ncbi:hypothetical protein PAAG_11190 [Paracoccidioides lutzii Pb01]|uniref:Uncharacterized protein n=1 Tax=Paracoccidioides lutzii (strain ATCC MYA-826 / Pb01) TaxID=502779 RepID=A0A0A2V7D0_PARBA|nr:hypothetical protein PAAG_11190 [Paracoccidioides lutzii Pb01]KGQ02015.1 hypothetical protein PAAG_11190 [Paracoccidioides lutzii Pb01]
MENAKVSARPPAFPLLEERQREVDRTRQRVRYRHWSTFWLLEGLLTWPASDPLEDERRQRNVGVEAVRQFCDFPEGGLLGEERPKRKVLSDGALHEDIQPEKKVKLEDRPSPFSWEEKMPGGRRAYPTVQEA